MTELTNEREAFEYVYAELNHSTPGGGWNDFNASANRYHEEDVHDAWVFWQAARRATPSSECTSLGPLPESKFCAWLLHGKVVNAFTHGVGDPAVWDHDKHWENKGYSRAPLYTAEQVEQIRREAVEADRRARSNSPEFDGIKTQPASAAQGVKTWQERCDWMSDEPATKLMVEAMKAEIYDLRAHLASEQQAKEYEQRHAAESEKALAQVQAQLARQSQEKPVAWLEAEPSARGRPAHEVIFSVIYSSRIHTKCAPMTSNPVWPLYAAPPLSSEPQKRA